MTTISIPRRVSALVHAAALATVPVQTADAQRQKQESTSQSGEHVFWRLRKSGGGSLHFLGSLHFGDQRLYPLPEVVRRAFDKSSRVIFETNLNGGASGSVGAIMMQAAQGGQERAMRQTVSPETLQTFRDTLDKLEMNLQHLEHYRTWYCANSLMTASLRHAGVNAGEGLDRVLFAQAALAEKTVVALESPESQIDLFAGLSDDEAEHLLLQALDEVAHTRDFVERMITAYSGGDLVALQAMVTDGFDEMPALKKRFFTDRNAAWMATIAEFAREEGDDFVVVGTGHLIGPEGLISLLRDAGCSVERL